MTHCWAAWKTSAAPRRRGQVHLSHALREVSAHAATVDGDTTAKVLSWIHRNVPFCGGGLLIGLPAGVDAGVLFPHPMLRILSHTPGLEYPVVGAEESVLLSRYLTGGVS
jgi:hypothetical protein